ncbi:MAG: DUF4249 domain-containing protein [Bacteroidales bacterium]|jgi:hypothetical protein|nr:DUF4249 domain-containing protein [Bacteroidales bacterium]
MNIILRYFHFVVGLCIIYFAASCEEEMKNFELPVSQPLLVIDAECNAMNDSITVQISKTVDFLGNAHNPPVEDAVITLRYNSIELPLVAQSAGRYVACAEFPDDTYYELLVEVEGKTYTAVSYMPRKVSFTEVKYEKLTHNPLFPMIQYGDTTFNVTLSFLDPQHETNFYRLLMYRNDTLVRRNDLTVLDDTYFTADTLHYTPWSNVYEGDTVVVELRSFDRAAYQFYTTMQAAMQAGGAFSLPDNPQSNFSGGVLGHFTAFSGDRRGFRIYSTVTNRGVFQQ